MSEFVDQCRHEWRRLGVPDRDANEMAADLSADLEDAEQDGVSPEEVLGEGALDARAFAASWASERGLVSSRWSDTFTNHRRIFVSAAVILLLVAAGATLSAVFAFRQSGPGQAITDAGIARRPAQTIASIAVPDVQHLGEEQAIAVAQNTGLQVEITIQTRKGVPGGTVVSQRPSPGETVTRGTKLALVVAR